MIKAPNIFAGTSASRLMPALVASLLIGMAAPHVVSANSEILGMTERIPKAFASVPFGAPDFSAYSPIGKNDVPLYFETRGQPDNTVNMDGEYPAFGPLQYNLAPRYRGESFLLSKEIQQSYGAELQALGGIEALREQRPAAILWLTARLGDPRFMEFYFAFSDRQYKYLESEMLKRYGLDIAARGELVVGFFKTIANHRPGDLFRIAARMTGEASAREIESMSDTEYVVAANRALVHVLGRTMRNGAMRDVIIRNYKSTLEHIMPHVEKAYLSNVQKQDMTADALERHLIMTAMRAALPQASMGYIHNLASQTVAENKDKIVIDDTAANLSVMQDAFIRKLSEYGQKLAQSAKTPKLALENADLSRLIAPLTALPPMMPAPRREEFGVRPRGLLARATYVRMASGQHS